MNCKILLLLFCSSIIIGCTHLTHPIPLDKPFVSAVGGPIGMAVEHGVNKSIIDNRLAAVDNYSGQLSVNLINNEPDKSEHFWRRSYGIKFVVDYNEWTQFFIDSWSTVLINKGIKVSPDSPNRILVKLNKLSTEDHFWYFETFVDVTLESGQWVKHYKGSATRHVTSESAVRYLNTSAIYQTFLVIMNDNEFLGQITN